MKAILLTVCGFFIGMTLSFGQSLTLSIPHEQVFVDETVTLDILSSDFDSIVSTQFSITWDPNIIRFDESQLIDLNFVAVGNSDANRGNLNISWFDIDGEGKSLADGQTFLRLDFTALGKIGDRTPVRINGDSLEIQVFQATGIPFEFKEITLNIEDGSVEIIEREDPQSTFQITDVQIVDIKCFGDIDGSISLVANDGNVIYNWTGPDGFFNNELSIENLIAGDYTLEVINEEGEVIFTNIYVVDGPDSGLEITNIATTESDCNSASGSASIEVIGGTPPYNFEIENVSTFTNGEIGSLLAGVYPIVITDANNCTIASTFEINQAGTFAFTLGGDIDACEGQVVNLSAGEFEEYNWSDGTAGESIEIKTSGEYTVTVTNMVGCTAIDTIVINFIDNVELQITQSEIIICPGDSVELSVSGGVNYEWIDPANELTDTQGSTVIVQPNENTTYTVISEGECGADELDIQVQLHQILATAGNDVCIPVGESVTLNASGGEFYYWSGSEYPLNAFDIPNPTALPEDSTRYFVMIIDENSCTTFDTVTVFVADDPISFIRHINMITPNGDGQNDVLDFGEISKFGSNNIRVFNRWGKIVYQKLNYQQDEERFTGVFDGEVLPAGNYYYVLSFRDNQQIKQTLTIARED